MKLTKAEIEKWTKKELITEIEKLNNTIDAFLQAAGYEEYLNRSLFDEDINEVTEEISRAVNDYDDIYRQLGEESSLKEFYEQDIEEIGKIFNPNYEYIGSVEDVIQQIWNIQAENAKFRRALEEIATPRIPQCAVFADRCDELLALKQIAENTLAKDGE